LNVTGAIDNRSPILILFKAGYAHERLNDRARPWDQLAPFSRDGNTLNPIPSYWNGKTIPLRRFDGSVAQYSEQLDFLQVSITTLLQYGECAFRAVPKFLWSVEQQRRVFQDQQVRSTLSSLTGLSDAFSGKCGSLKSFVEEHAK
jgi:hypothetical protein